MNYQPGVSGEEGNRVKIESDNSEPVTISIARRVIPGREADYEAWIKGITAQALTFPGHMGVNVIRPTAPSTEYVTIFRFDSCRHSRDWEQSPERAQWLDRLADIVEGQGELQKGTGMEFWFSLPELPASHPSPHKMALVLFMVVFCLVLILNWTLAPFTGDWSVVGRVFLAVFLQVTLMTYLVMPRVTRLLKPWLFS